MEGRDILCSQKIYGNGNYLIASALNLPFRDSCFDLVTSLQVIEHIEGKDVNRLLREVSRVLKDDGVFIVTTPNRRLRLLPFQKPWNPEHKKEYDYKEFEIILKKFFSNVQIFVFSLPKTCIILNTEELSRIPLWYTF